MSKFVATFVTNHAGHVLLVRHRERAWELPGGRVEPAETVPHAAARECKEETGYCPLLAPRPPRVVGDCSVWFGVLECDPNPKDRVVIAEARWCSREEVRALALSDVPSAVVLREWAVTDAEATANYDLLATAVREAHDLPATATVGEMVSAIIGRAQSAGAGVCSAAVGEGPGERAVMGIAHGAEVREIVARSVGSDLTAVMREALDEVLKWPSYKRSDDVKRDFPGLYPRPDDIDAAAVRAREEWLGVPACDWKRPMTDGDRALWRRVVLAAREGMAEVRAEDDARKTAEDAALILADRFATTLEQAQAAPTTTLPDEVRAAAEEAESRTGARPALTKPAVVRARALFCEALARLRPLPRALTPEDHEPDDLRDRVAAFLDEQEKADTARPALTEEEARAWVVSNGWTDKDGRHAPICNALLSAYRGEVPPEARADKDGAQ